MGTDRWRIHFLYGRCCSLSSSKKFDQCTTLDWNAKNMARLIYWFHSPAASIRADGILPQCACSDAPVRSSDLACLPNCKVHDAMEVLEIIREACHSVLPIGQIRIVGFCRSANLVPFLTTAVALCYRCRRRNLLKRIKSTGIFRHRSFKQSDPRSAYQPLTQMRIPPCSEWRNLTAACAPST